MPVFTGCPLPLLWNFNWELPYFVNSRELQFHAQKYSCMAITAIIVSSCGCMRYCCYVSRTDEIGLRFRFVCERNIFKIYLNHNV